jgi:colanic acid biosynthesis glycosyl transferase WcaI
MVDLTLLGVIIAGLSVSEQEPNHNAKGDTERQISVMIINQSFWPDVVATAQQAHDLAKYLAARGDKVTVLTSRSLYGKKGAALRKFEIVDGVEIHRVSRNLFNKRGLVTRAFDYLRFNVTCAIRALFLPRHDVVICLTTPPFVALVGALLRLTKGSRFVFWTMDLYPDLPVEAGIIRRNSLAHRLLSAIDFICLKNADRIVTLGRCMRQRVESKGLSPSKISMIHPWSDPEEILELPVRCLEPPIDALASARSGNKSCGPNRYRQEWDIGDRFVIQYSGNFGLGHDAETVFGAMLALKEDDGIRWVIVGDGVMRPVVEEFVKTHKIANVLLKPYQEREALGTLLSLGDVHLVLMVPGFDGVILPSKLYGVLSAGRPAIFVGPDTSEIARVITENHCGMVVQNGNSEGLVQVLNELRANPTIGLTLGHRGRKVLESKYSMTHACRAWRELLHELVYGDGRATPGGGQK